MRRAWLFLGSLQVLAVGAWSQGSKILGRDDGVFARRLYERGYSELAEVVCDALIAAGGGELGAGGVLQAQALLLEVRQASARTERDLGRGPRLDPDLRRGSATGPELMLMGRRPIH